MAATDGRSMKWLTFSFSLAVAAISVTSAAIHAYIMKKKDRDLHAKIRQLEISLNSSLNNCAAERTGRIRAQQALRYAIAEPKADNLELTFYPMKPIATIKSCFSTRNGTPRQPLVVPLAKACLIFDTAQAPPASLEGLGEYSHCWIIYVFHLNTNLEKLWKQPHNFRLKAKVRVPRLKGEKMGVFATRSPHRPCPIGLTVAKVEAVKGHTVFLSGVDLVDGTPVLDIKPYLPYCDSIKGATVPNWVAVDNPLAVASVSFSEEFTSSLSQCWATTGKESLYASADEFQCLIKQVLSWDIRSLSQRIRPHNARATNGEATDVASSLYEDESKQVSLPSSCTIIYNLILEGLNVSYSIDSDSNVVVKYVSVSSNLSCE